MDAHAPKHNFRKHKKLAVDPGSTTEKFARMNLQMSIDVLRSELVHTPLM